MTNEETSALQVGDRVRAVRALDPIGANVAPDTHGIVVEERDAFGDGCGPLIGWATGAHCNVYGGDVTRIAA